MGGEYWLSFDYTFMEICAQIVVLKLDGWEESMGVQREIAFFQSRGLPVRFLEVSDISVPPHLKILSPNTLAMNISGITDHNI